MATMPPISKGPLELVVFPGTAGEISEILKLANQHHFPVVPRGMGTGLTGGSVPIQGGVVLVMTRFNRILEIDQKNLIAVVEPGVITGDFQKRLKPWDFSSLRIPPVNSTAPSVAMWRNVPEVPGP